MKRLLLIGDTSLQDALGSKLLRGAKEFELDQSWEINFAYHSPATNYSPSMRQKLGKVFYRLADKRSWEWWNFQQVLVENIKEMKPELENLNLKLKAERRKIIVSIMKQAKQYADELGVQLQENKRNIKVLLKK